MKGSRKLIVLAAACALVSGKLAKASSVSSGIVVDGTLDAGYGAPLATQTINTGFGDSTYTGTPNGPDATGSELDAAYAVVQSNTLYLFLAGNFENNGNLVNIFIDDGRGGSNTLSANNGNLANMNGSVFSSGFNPTYAIDANDYQGNFYVNTETLYDGGPENYIQSVPLTKGIGSATLATIQFGVNNSNIAGVTGDPTGSAASAAAADAVTTGLEIGLPLSLLGNPQGTIKIMADINGGNDGYLSNQFLPGLPVGTTNLGTGTPAYSGGANTGIFNFSTLANEYFTVTAPAANGNWISSNGGNWGDSTNWSNGVVPNGVGATANFSNAAGGTVTVNGNFTVGTLTFTTPASGNYTLASNSPSPSSITFSNSGSDATITDYGGMHFIETDLVLTSNTDVTIINNGDSLYFLGNISGPGALSSFNPGGYNSSVMYLGGNDNYTGGTIVNSGLLQLGSSGAFPASTPLSFNASDVPDPTLDLDGESITVSALSSVTGANTVSTGSMGLIINSGSSAIFTYAGNAAHPDTFFGRFIDNSATGGGQTSLVITSGSLTINGYSGNTSNVAPNPFTGATTINSGATLTLAAASEGGALNGTSGITNNGTLNVNDVESVSQISGTGALTVGAGGNLQLKSGSGLSHQASLTMSGGGVLDVTNEGLVITYGATDPIATIRGYFQAGEIITSTSATVPGTSVGYADGSTDTGTSAAAGTILIRYTYLGDLNLDGSVNSTDYNILIANLGKTNEDWAHGDLNYDGVVNADDVSLFMYGLAEAGSNTISVPEPAALGLIALPLLGLRRKRMV